MSSQLQVRNDDEEEEEEPTARDMLQVSIKHEDESAVWAAASHGAIIFFSNASRWKSTSCGGSRSVYST